MAVSLLRSSLGVLALSCLSCSPPAIPLPSDAGSAAPSTTPPSTPVSSAEVSASPPGSSAPAAATFDHVTSEIPPALVSALVGCWEAQGNDERWQLDRAGASGIAVTRHVEGGLGDYARRAKIPTALLHDPSRGTFGFPAAGRIHALLFSFTRAGEDLEVDSSSRRLPSEPWHSTGSHFTMHRCAGPPMGR